MSELISGKSNVRPDPQMAALVADYFEQGGLSRDRIVVQVGWFNRRYYVMRVRFRDLYQMSGDGAQKILFFVEHCFDTELFSKKHGGNGTVPNQALIAWVLGMCAQTLPMAHAEWVQIRHLPWPAGFPRAETYQTRRRDIGISPETLERLTGDLTKRRTA